MEIPLPLGNEKVKKSLLRFSKRGTYDICVTVFNSLNNSIYIFLTFQQSGLVLPPKISIINLISLS